MSLKYEPSISLRTMRTRMPRRQGERGEDPGLQVPDFEFVLVERLVIYCQTSSVSAALATHCATYCTPCRPLLRAFSGWILAPPPTVLGVGVLVQLSGERGRGWGQASTRLRVCAWSGRAGLAERREGSGLGCRGTSLIRNRQVPDFDGGAEGEGARLLSHLRQRGSCMLGRGEGWLINPQTRPLHASEGDETRHQGSNSP